MPVAADTHCPYCALQCAMSLTPVEAAPTADASDVDECHGYAAPRRP